PLSLFLFLPFHFFSHTIPLYSLFSFFFYNAPATTEIYTLSLHDALPISFSIYSLLSPFCSFSCISTTRSIASPRNPLLLLADRSDRKSTRLNSSHVKISYAVFCLKKKNKIS